MIANLKTISLILFSLLFLSSLTKTVAQEDNGSLSEKKAKNQDCIFDQETQSDEFLKGIEELKKYSWNSKTKTATIKISEEETLEIFRGGCDHFLLQAKFTVKKGITFYKDKDFIFSKLLWISKLIYHKSEYEKIKECISKNKYSIDDTNPAKIHINLMDHEIYNSFIIFYDAENSNTNTFSIESFLN